MEFAFVGPQTPDGWSEWSGHNYEVTDEGVVLATMPVPTYVAPDPVIEGLPGNAAIVDIDLDECGTLYLLDGDGNVYQYEPGTDRLTHLACTWYEGEDLGEDLDPQAICVTPDSLYLADGAGGRVHAFSRHLLQTRWIVSDPFDMPVDLAASDGTVHVLDRGPGPGEGFIATLDKRGTVDRVVTGMESPAEVAIDTTGNRYVLDLLVRSGDGDAAVRKFDVDHAEFTDDTYPLTEFTVRGTTITFDPSCIEVGDEDELITGVGPDADGEKTLFRFSVGDRAFERVPTFKRGCVNLRLDRTTESSSGLYVVDESERSVSFLTQVTHNRQNSATGRYDAQVRTRLDSGEFEMEWHRVTAAFDLDGTGTQVRLRYVATDDEKLTEDLEAITGIGTTYAGRLRDVGVRWISDLVDLTPAEISDVTGASETEAAGWLDQAEQLLVEWGSLGRPDPRDALLEDAVGQYLWVELSLLGTESTSPRVGSFRAYFPRQSYLRHLPTIYEQHQASAAFLERYLSIFESVFTDIEEEIGSSTRYLDSQGIPSEYLSWLGRWLAVDAGETWPESAERELLERAPALFKKRGTREGLLELIRVFLGIEDADASDQSATDADTNGRSEADVSTDARFSSEAWAHAHEREQAVVQRLEEEGHLTTAEAEAELEAHESLPGVYDQAKRLYLMEYSAFDCIDADDVLTAYRQVISCPQCFLVMVRPSIDDEQLRTIRQIVDAETPAHAAGRAIELKPWIQLGSNAYLGVNSTLPSRKFVLEDAELGADSVLAERESGFHLGRRSRLDGDAHVS